MTKPEITTNRAANANSPSVADVAARAEALARDLASMATTPGERKIVAAIGRQALDRAFSQPVRP